MPYDIISVPTKEIDLNDIEFSKGYTGSSPKEALSYIKNAEFSTKSFLRPFEQVFYSKNGITYVNLRTGEVTRSYPKEYFKNNEKKIMGVLE